MKKISILLLTHCFYFFAHGQTNDQISTLVLQDKNNFNLDLQQQLPAAVVFPDSYTSFFIYEPSNNLKELAGDKGNVKNIPDQIVQLASSYQRTGVSADGVTKLIIIIRQETDQLPPGYTPLPNLTLSLPSDKDGLLSKLETQDNKSTTQTVAARTLYGKKYVIAIYSPPDGYGEDPAKPKNARPTRINISAAGAGTTVDISLKIYIPPVIMIHGVWSNGTLWKASNFEPFLKAQSFINVELTDYVSDETWFYGSLTTTPSGVTNLDASIKKALDNYESGKLTSGLRIAATQVDVVAHSMGGLVSRAFVQSNLNKLNSNYFLGAVHKLITLGTPHYGTPLSRVLWCRKDEKITTKYYGFTVHPTVTKAFASTDRTVGTAVQDAIPGSTALTFLGNTQVKTHTISGNYKTSEVAAYNDWNTVVSMIWPGSPGVDNIFRDNHDLIVGVNSQLGGLSGDKTDSYIDIIHFLPKEGATNNTETNSPVVQQRVKFLLLTDEVSKYFASSLPTPIPDPNPPATPCAGILPPPNISGINKGFTGDNQQFSSNAVNEDAYIRIISPTAASIIPSNTPDSISLEFETVGVTPVNALFLVKGIGMFTVPNQPPYRKKFKLPYNTPVNRVFITVLVRDRSGILYGDNSIMFIQPVGSITNLSVSPTSLLFDSLYNHQPLSVTSNLISGSSTSLIDLTHTQAGTTYKLRRGDAVAQVDEKGLVTALHAGSDVLEVRYNNNLITVAVNVTSTCSAQKPVISVSGVNLTSSSSSGNQWYLNDVPIKDANGSTYTATDPGSYSVQVNKTCSSPMSDKVQINNSLLISVKAFLQGGYTNGMMADSFRTLHLLPSVDPYYTLGFTVANINPNTESISLGLLDSTGNKAVTDWIWLELRDSLDPRRVINTRSAIIRRDGNIVDVDGYSPVRFYDMPNGRYYVAVRHRNHLGIMTAAAVSLNTGSSTSINFTLPATATYGTNAQKNVNGTMVMWAGDVNRDGVIKYNGSTNDKNAILSKIGLSNPATSLISYDGADVNLDGTVKYTGSINDKNVILGNVGLGTPANTITEQLPK